MSRSIGLYGLFLMANLLVLASCENQGGTDTNTGQKSLTALASIKQDSQQILIAVYNEGTLAAVFDEKTEQVKLQYKNHGVEKNIDLCRCFSTLQTPPEVEFVKLGNGNIGIVIIINLVQLGISIDGITLYQFNPSNMEAKEACDISDIAEHDMELDTLTDIVFYDYNIDTNKQKLTIKEYIPFKSITKSRLKYKTKITECSYNK